MNVQKRPSGHLRLGIVLTVSWLALFATVYFASIWLYPNLVTLHFAWAYEWWETADLGMSPIPPAPYPSGVALAAALLPAFLGWLLLFLLPLAVRWVRDGYRVS